MQHSRESWNNLDNCSILKISNLNTVNCFLLISYIYFVVHYSQFLFFYFFIVYLFFQLFIYFFIFLFFHLDICLFILIICLGDSLEICKRDQKQQLASTLLFRLWIIWIWGVKIVIIAITIIIIIIIIVNFLKLMIK